MGTSLPRDILPLNGVWEIAPGLATEIPPIWRSRVPVPALVDCAQPAYDWQAYGYHWYRLRFNPGPFHQHETAILRLDQAMYGTQVWLNNVPLGGDIACYTSEEYSLAKSILYDRENELVVRVGLRETLPPESAVGKDQERQTFIPGIWGDVNLVFAGNPRIKLVQVIPHIDTSHAEVRVTVENLSAEPLHGSVRATVFEKRSGSKRSRDETIRLEIEPAQEQVAILSLRIDDLHLWSTENPFLYEAEIAASVEGRVSDSLRTTFGMREFKAVGPDFFFNGKRIFLKGGNIAFHRFLSDADRGTLPWNLPWVKKLLIDIPKAHNFNFFRHHLGHVYNRWYDIADEHGMLLQDEWPFWTTSGTKNQITLEFTRWLQDNWNHPSIIIWDALNECSDAVVENEIIPKLKLVDPTRPWAPVDFVEDHPYIYSLGPVLHDRKYGFTRSLDEIERSPTPSVVNEFLWWWLDKENQPSQLTKEVVERWLGPDYAAADLITHQSYLAQELVELFRRMRVDAIQPFVYLSNNAGPTAHWFMGNIGELRPKPILKTLKNAFAPFGVSIELWDRHLVVGEYRSLRIYVFNDGTDPKEGMIRYGVTSKGGSWLHNAVQPVKVLPGESSIIQADFKIPEAKGEYRIRAELVEGGKLNAGAISEKIIHALEIVKVPANLHNAGLALLDARGEIFRFLRSNKVSCGEFEKSQSNQHVLIVGEGLLGGELYKNKEDEVKNFVETGGSLVVIEPESGLEGRNRIRIVEGVELEIERRPDADRGGFDSYIIAEDHAHPLWEGIDREHLKMFNGGFGGEAVSQHNVVPNVQHTVLARCGLKLGVIVTWEIPCVKGTILVSRLQLRGRLVRNQDSDSLYARRVDPVAQRYLLNLLSYAVQCRD